MLVGVCNGLPCRSEVELGTQSAIAVVQGVMKIDAGGLLASATVVIVKSSQIVDHVTVGFTGPERDIITDVPMSSVDYKPARLWFNRATKQLGLGCSTLEIMNDGSLFTALKSLELDVANEVYLPESYDGWAVQPE